MTYHGTYAFDWYLIYTYLSCVNFLFLISFFCLGWTCLLWCATNLALLQRLEAVPVFTAAVLNKVLAAALSLVEAETPPWQAPIGYGRPIILFRRILAINGPRERCLDNVLFTSLDTLSHA